MAEHELPHRRPAPRARCSSATASSVFSGGAVRVSLGLATNFADVYRFMSFAAEFRDLTDMPAELPPRLAC